MSSNEFSQRLKVHSATYLKTFVQSKTSCLSSISSITESNESPNEHLTNNSDIDAKVIYEDIVGTEGFIEGKKTKIGKQNHKQKKKNSCTTVANATQFFNFNLLMKAAELNNVSLVQELCQENNKLYINQTDVFGWTPLMSACCAGAIDVVKLFLHWKPDVMIKDKRGNNCWNLAKCKGHFSILQLLNDYAQNNNSKYFDQESTSVERPKISTVKFYCEPCKQNIEDLSRSKHESSMMHLFNSAPKNNMPTMYGIPESNKGFQILLKGGWDKEKGLGPEGTGHKFPPKTILKQDKTGLGAKEYKARVTHILNMDDKNMNCKHSVRTHLKKRNRNEKRLEKKLRQMLS